MVSLSVTTERVWPVRLGQYVIYKPQLCTYYIGGLHNCKPRSVSLDYSLCTVVLQVFGSL